ncbi:tetratricopeptide repeat protein [Novosphingobium sp. BL-8H]|uniref:tetratricopeptide repeat protein n=1 Tax=Novosphingobium sp. BL-8H TaxID=3127640 RepID=UPI0037563793
MSLTAIFASVLLAQTPAALAVDVPVRDSVDVAYQDLSSGRAEEALRKLEASAAARPDDPATLINLGAAYAATGRTDKALLAYRAAINSQDRYDLQLADGTWADSRDTARMAMQKMLRANAQASR